MKPNNYTLPSVGFSLKSATKIRAPFLLPYLLIVFCLFISLVSFAGEFINYNRPVLDVNSSYSIFQTTTASPLTGPESIRTNLYLLNANNTTILADGVFTEYNNLYHDSVSLEDAYKFTNIKENLGLSRYGTVLAVERRPVISASDTLFFKLWKTSMRNYQLEFITLNLNHPALQAFLEDAYLGTSTILALSGTTKINFTINTDIASANVNRFKIVYKTSMVSSPLPVTFTSVKGFQNNKNISINWKVENEINIDKYEIERSANSIDFIKLNSIAVTGLNNAYGSYSWLDENPIDGNNFYRIRSIDRDGTKKFSLIVKVSTGKISAASIAIYPNPIIGNMVNLRFTNQPIGVYQVRLISNSGQLVYATQFSLNSGNVSQTLFTNKNLAGGFYQMEIKSPDNTIQIQKALIQE